jgi:hypothetical protein
MVIEDDNTGGDDRVKDLKAENARNAATRAGRLKDAEAAHEVYFADCILFVPYPFVVLFYVVLCCVVLCCVVFLVCLVLCFHVHTASTAAA